MQCPARHISAITCHICMGIEDIVTGLTDNVSVSARIGESEFALNSVRTWRGRDKKWRLSGNVGTKSVLDLVGSSMLGPNKNPADVILQFASKNDVQVLHANLTSSMESGTIVEITFTLLDD